MRIDEDLCTDAVPAGVSIRAGLVALGMALGGGGQFFL